MLGRDVIVLAFLTALLFGCDDDPPPAPVGGEQAAASLEEIGEAPSEEAATEPEPEPERPPLPVLAVGDLESMRALHEVAQDLAAVRLMTTASLSLRTAPSADAALVRILPKGTIVIGFHGEVGEHTSAAGGRGSWTHIAASDAHLGWASSRFLAPDDGALPDVASLLEALPTDVRASHGGETSVGRMPLSAEEDAGILTLVEAEGRTHLAISSRPEDGTVEVLSRHEVVGVVESATHLGEDGAVLVSYRGTPARVPRTLTHWAVFRAGETGAVYDEELPTDDSYPARLRARVRAPAEDASGSCAFAVFMPEAQMDAMGYAYSGEYCRAYHTGRRSYVVMW